MNYDKIFHHLRRSTCLLFRAVLAALIALTLFTAAPKVAFGPGVSQDDSELRCIVSAVYHEARGEPDKGKRAVVDTIYHRTSKYGKPICEVVAQNRQFPWYKKKGLVDLTPETLAFYNAAMSHPVVLTDENYIFFNGVKPPGHACKRIGHHTFCKEKNK